MAPAELTKAMFHPVRAGIVRLLAGQETCMYGELSERLPLAKSTVASGTNPSHSAAFQATVAY